MADLKSNLALTLSNNILLDLTQQRNSVSNHTIVQVTMQLQLTSCLLCLMKNDHVNDRLRKGPRYQKKKNSDTYIFKKPFSVRRKPRDTNFSFASRRN